MNLNVLRVPGQVVILVAQFSLTACWASSWTTPIASFPAAILSPAYGDVSGQILVLPLWQEYRDTKCEFRFFFAPPLMLPVEQLPQLQDHLQTYKTKATIYLFAHPTWRLSPDLLGVYMIYPDGRIVWAGNSHRDPWNEFQGAIIGQRWRQTLLAGLRAGHVGLSEPATAKDLFMLPERSTNFPTCDSNSSDPCCYVDLVAFRVDNVEQSGTAIRYLEALPADEAMGQTELWHPIHWTFSFSPDVMPNHGFQPTDGAPSSRASCSIPALRAAGG